MEKILEEIGLTPGEARVYLALLELGFSTVSPISKKARVSISKIYSVLEGLIRKGLVSSIVKNNVKHFNAANPERIIDFLEKKKKKIEQEENEVKKKLPELKSKLARAEKKSVAEVYEGVKGIKTFFEKMLLEVKEGDMIYVFGIPREVSVKYEGYFLHDWSKKRIQKKVKTKIIYNFDARDVGKKRAKLKLTELRYFPKEIQTPAWINIYGNVVSMTYMIGDSPFCVVIRDENIAKSHLAYFNFLWKLSKK
ncbi:helix-turn-helix domain-containing protein [Candidatus Pacearchaeota archaeon]|nr:helix-turn-helix domain-containing protein [Candidatus Pacearchaeota archaeon]